MLYITYMWKQKKDNKLVSKTKKKLADSEKTKLFGAESRTGLWDGPHKASLVTVDDSEASGPPSLFPNWQLVQRCLALVKNRKQFSNKIEQSAWGGLRLQYRGYLLVVKPSLLSTGGAPPAGLLDSVHVPQSQALGALCTNVSSSGGPPWPP